MKAEEINRRSGGDRRKNNIPDIKSMLMYHRRKTSRREEDNFRFTYFDQYGVKLFVAIVSILFLSIIDALLTLYLVDHGASEMNPIMDFYLQMGPYVFIFAKYSLTAFSLILLLLFSNYYIRKAKIHVRALFQYTAVLFGMVIGWELILVLRVLH